MIGSRIKSTISKVAARAKERKRHALETRTLMDDFHDYLIGPRSRNMWENQGRIMGPWGKGTRKWAQNADSTIRQKGFDKPLYSTRTGSSFKKPANIIWRYRRQVRGNQGHTYLEFGVRKKHAEYNHEGTATIPARPFMGFFHGDVKWLNYQAAKRALKVSSLNESNA